MLESGFNLEVVLFFVPLIACSDLLIFQMKSLIYRLLIVEMMPKHWFKVGNKLVDDRDHEVLGMGSFGENKLCGN
jgi:hypothetical protein